jgi:hypothetical protein
VTWDSQPREYAVKVQQKAALESFKAQTVQPAEPSGLGQKIIKRKTRKARKALGDHVSLKTKFRETYFASKYPQEQPMASLWKRSRSRLFCRLLHRF